MSIVTDFEKEAVDALLAANLPELRKFAIEALGGQVDLENDELSLAVPHILIAVVGGDHGTSGADSLDLAFVACVPGGDQQVRRQEALDALFAIRIWMDDSSTRYQPRKTRMERIHPVTVAALFASLIG